MTERDPDFKFAAPPVNHVPVWDLGVRLFHWALVLLVVGAVVFIKIDKMQYHSWCGYGILTLLIFRILWGFVGGTHARFASFIAGPGKVLAYMKGMFSRDGHESGLGHNPVGALSVLAMLLVFLFQACSGLFTNDEDFAFDGPLYKWVGKDLSDKITSLHRLNEWVIYALVGVHIAAIAFYALFHKENLVRPMLTGYRKVEGALSDLQRRDSAGDAVFLKEALA